MKKILLHLIALDETNEKKDTLLASAEINQGVEMEKNTKRRLIEENMESILKITAIKNLYSRNITIKENDDVYIQCDCKNDESEENQFCPQLMFHRFQFKTMFEILDSKKYTKNKA